MKKTERKVYSYPDAGDKITTSLIRQIESFNGQWESSEKEILNLIEQYFKKSSDSWLLDAGCGSGRLLPTFQNYFDKILAIDPDSTQIEKAKILVEKHGFGEKVTFEVTTVEALDWPKESIDAILCSHVLQHIHTDSVPTVLQKFNFLSKAGALLFIMTTKSAKKNYYAKEYLRRRKVVEEIISKQNFNSLTSNKKNVLPLHFFSLTKIRNALQTAGYELLDYRPFHFLDNVGPQKKKTYRGSSQRLCNFSHNLLARDMLLVGRKTG